MAIYVTSDLHGLNPQKLKQLLSVIGFCKSDWLFILGDVIDRNGDGGVALLTWLTLQPNVQLIRGNHEQMLLDNLWIFESISASTLSKLDEKKLNSLNNWIANGGYPTICALKKLKDGNPEKVKILIEYLKETPLFEVVEVNGKAFVLCHSGFKNFDNNKKLSRYTKEDLLYNRPNENDCYFKNALTIFGHTPTEFYGAIGKAFKTKTWIDIDVGCSKEKPPMFLRLDDLKEIYFD